MPDIPVGAQIFDLAFHPTSTTVFTGLLTGEIKAFSYDDQGAYNSKFSIRPSKRSCRGLAMSESGDRLWAVGKGKSLLLARLHTSEYLVLLDVGKIELTVSVTSVAINRVKRFLPNMLCTGDDDGVIKLWDPRKQDALRSYTHHFDFISDFLWLEDKKHLVATSGDGTLSVIDVRSKKIEPFAQSEDQEDELLSIVAIKGGQKIVVGTQLGILSIFNRKSGWGDCVDRIPGHPHSIDALCTLPSSYPSSHSTVLTGSSDGLLRAVQLLPTKLLGVVADHGEFPIERIAVDLKGEGRWVGSVGHEEVLKLTDLKEVFEDEDGDESGEEGSSSEDEEDGEEEEAGLKMGNNERGKQKAKVRADTEDEDESESDASEKEGGETSNHREVIPGGAEESVSGDQEEGASSSDDSDVFSEGKKRKKKKDLDPMKTIRRKKGRNEIDAEPSFFADL